jgi:DNA (cytosine-5)-methyltransferase 1
MAKRGKAWAIDLSMWSRHEPYRHLADIVDLDNAPQLSARATSGFFSRTQKSSLNFVDEFIVDVAEHADVMAEELAVA